jgi:heme/copper-type cytochrome/quinol oxidase subunit 4
MEENIKMDHPGMGKNNYMQFVLMLVVSFIAMYITMYLNTYAIDHVYFSLTRFYMSCMGIVAMAVIMFMFMRKMYRNKKKNMIILFGSLGLFIEALVLVRAQRPIIGDILWMKAMIPHHSIAILTSERADIEDPEVKKLAEGIIKAQKEEIEEMKAMINRLQSAKK